MADQDDANSVCSEPTGTCEIEGCENGVWVSRCEEPDICPKCHIEFNVPTHFPDGSEYHPYNCSHAEHTFRAIGIYFGHTNGCNTLGTLDLTDPRIPVIKERINKIGCDIVPFAPMHRIYNGPSLKSKKAIDLSTICDLCSKRFVLWGTCIDLGHIFCKRCSTEILGVSDERFTSNPYYDNATLAFPEDYSFPENGYYLNKLGEPLTLGDVPWIS